MTTERRDRENETTKTAIKKKIELRTTIIILSINREARGRKGLLNRPRFLPLPAPFCPIWPRFPGDLRSNGAGNRSSGSARPHHSREIELKWVRESLRRRPLWWGAGGFESERIFFLGCFLRSGGNLWDFNIYLWVWWVFFFFFFWGFIF